MQPRHRPLRVVTAFDSFKGSLSAVDACAAASRGVREAFPDAIVIERPMADGGEGTLDALASAWRVEPVAVETVDAIGRPTVSAYALHDGLAVVELATANGLPGVSDVPLRPREATTKGTGEVLRTALLAGATEVLFCVGGSASTDGGSGILTALGAQLLDERGEPIVEGGAGLASVATIDVSGVLPQALSASWRIAVDVTNPLCGPAGAAAIFGPQKGASPADVAYLDSALARWANVLKQATGADTALLPGAGAAGGVPAGLAALFGATFQPGADLIADAIGLADACAGADLVLTGEGRFDAQSLHGKVVDGVVRTANGVPVVVLAGEVTLDFRDYHGHGVAAAFSIAPGACDLTELSGNAAPLLAQSAAAAAAASLAGRGAAVRRVARR